MKTIAVFLVTSLLVFSTFAQPGKNLNHRGNETQNERHYHPGTVEQKSFNLLNPKISLKNGMIYKQKLDSMFYYVWNEVVNDWIIDYKSHYEFNEQGLITEFYDFWYDQKTDSWIPNDRETYKYTENGALEEYVDFDRIEGETGWFSFWKREYRYENNRLIEFIEYEKETTNDDWYLSWKQNFVYNDENLLTNVLESYYIMFWREYWKAEYGHDEQDNMTNFSSHYFESDIDQWINDETEVYAYNEANKLITWSEKEWDDTEDEWTNSDKEDYSYATNGDIMVLLDYDWDGSINDWEQSWKEEYTYNPDIAYEEIMLPWFFHDDHINFFNHALNEYQSVTFENEQWVPDAKGNYFFSEITDATNISNILGEKLTMYPNPATKQLNISGMDETVLTLQIFDMTGRMRISEPVYRNQPVNISKLNPGFYLLHLRKVNHSLIHTEKIQIID